MTLRITIFEEGSKRAFDRVTIPVPRAPPSGPDGGYWKWVGPLPSADVDLGSGLTLVLRVIQTDSVEARERLRATRAPSRDRAEADKPRSEPRAEVLCPRCGKRLLGRAGLAPHLRSCDPKPKVEPAALISCPTCGKEFDSPSKLGPHRRMAHGYKSGRPGARQRPGAPREVSHERTGPVPDLPLEPGMRELATGILEAARGGPEPVDDARAVKIALIIGEKFRGSFGGEGAPFAEDSDLDAEERAELSILDGRMIAHRIVGRGRGRTHFWLFKPGGVPQGDTVREIVPGVEA